MSRRQGAYLYLGTSVLFQSQYQGMQEQSWLFRMDLNGSIDLLQKMRFSHWFGEVLTQMFMNELLQQCPLAFFFLFDHLLDKTHSSPIKNKGFLGKGTREFLRQFAHTHVHMCKLKSFQLHFYMPSLMSLSSVVEIIFHKIIEIM